jgi:hypothetical protein
MDNRLLKAHRRTLRLIRISKRRTPRATKRMETNQQQNPANNAGDCREKCERYMRNHANDFHQRIVHCNSRDEERDRIAVCRDIGNSFPLQRREQDRQGEKQRQRNKQVHARRIFYQLNSVNCRRGLTAEIQTQQLARIAHV